MAKKPIVTQKPEVEPIPTEILAQSIVEIAASFKKIEAGRLKRRALVLLIYDACTGVSKSAINAVLDTLPDLERLYLK